MPKKSDNKLFRTGNKLPTNCPVCHNEPAQIHKTLGILLGAKCQARRRGNALPDTGLVEMVGDNIKRERKQYAKSSIQPFRSDGTFSAEYYDAYGTKGVSVTPEQVKKRKKIWDKVISPNFDITKSK